MKTGHDRVALIQAKHGEPPRLTRSAEIILVLLIFLSLNFVACYNAVLSKVFALCRMLRHQ